MKPSQFSNTAAFLAIKFYGLTHEKRFCALFSDDIINYYADVVKFLPAPHSLYQPVLKNRWMRRFFIFWEELLLPGDLMHLLLRKWYFNKIVGRLKQNGYTQLLALGAGFDHTAALHSSNSFHAIELDANHMSALKRQFLDKFQYQNTNLHIFDGFISADSPLRTFLDKPEIDPLKKTVVVAEGFFDYLHKEQVSILLQDLGRYFKAPFTLVSTFNSQRELSPLRSFVYDKSIRLAGEQLKLNITKEQFINLLKEHGFSVEKTIDHRQMIREVMQSYNLNMPILDGFYIVEAFHHAG